MNIEKVFILKRKYVDTLTFSSRIPKDHLQLPWKALGTLWRKPALESTRNSPAKLSPLWAAKFHQRALRTPGSNLTSVKTLRSIVKTYMHAPLASFFLAPAASWRKSSHLQSYTTVLAFSSNRSGFTCRVWPNQIVGITVWMTTQSTFPSAPPWNDCGSHLLGICQVPVNFRPSEGHQRLSPFITIKSSIVTKWLRAEKWLHGIGLDPPLFRDLSGLNAVWFHFS